MKVVVQIVDDTDQETTLSGKDLEQVVDQDIEGFRRFFATVDDGDLTGPEKSIIKTYLWWKTNPKGEVRGT